MINIGYTRQKEMDLSTTRQRSILSGNSSIPVTYAPQVETFVDVKNYTITKGVDTPHYFKLKRQGKLLPLTLFDQEESKYTGSMTWSLSHSGGYWQSCDWSPVWHTLPSIAELHAHGVVYDTDYSVQAAAAKIYESGWDALTFIAELRQTLAMFTNLAQRFIAKLRSGKLEDIWLEGRYGWRTLYFDMVDVQDMLSNLDDERKRFRESCGMTFDEQRVHSQAYALGSAGDYDVVWTDTWRVGLRGTVVADVDPPKVQFNPLTTAWEIVRFSFIVDWFLNVGQALAALSFLLISHEYYAAGGIQVALTRETSVGNFRANADWTGAISGSSTATYIWTHREPTSVSLFPLTSVRLDAYKIVDLLALIVQAIRK